VITPEEEPAVATAAVPDDHVPPPVVLLNVTDDPAHTTTGPVIAEGYELTATGVVMVQPVLIV
jgi:hypothetical protein